MTNDTIIDERKTERLAEKFLTDALATLASAAADQGCICPNCGEPQALAEIAHESVAGEWDTRSFIVAQACDAVAAGGRRELRRVARTAIKQRDRDMLELLNVFVTRLRLLWPEAATPVGQAARAQRQPTG